MIQNAIGNKPFTVFLGNPQDIIQHTEILSRPGVDGFGVRRIGSRGRPFDMTSKTDFATGLLGRVMYEEYMAMIARERYHMRWEGIDFNDDVIVLGVEQVQLKVVSCILGGINVAAGSSGAILECKWTLAFLN